MRLTTSWKRSIVAPITLAVCLSVFSVQAAADDYSDPSLSDTSVSVSEGPYVLWRASDCVTVFYLCGEEIVSHDFKSADTIRFTGLCEDSLRQYAIACRSWEIAPIEYTGVSKIFAVSDIHGEYEVFESLLKNAGVIDDNLNWTFGDGHLVIDGDVFDRGDRVTECLWLIYRLEQEAPGRGGRVHFLLGNHEKMVLRGDLRYIHESYEKGIRKKTRITYDDLFGPDMELGRWLRSKNTIIRINDVLFVHAGIIPWVVEQDYTMEQINEVVRKGLDLRSYDLAFGAEPGLFVGREGPLWYRGWLEENGYPKETPDQIRRTLDHFGARKVVVGHTGVEQVGYLQNGLVIGIDVPVEDLGCLQGLLIENSEFYRVLGSGQKELLE